MLSPSSPLFAVSASPRPEDVKQTVETEGLSSLFAQGNYELQFEEKRNLGRGAMGTVVLAECKECHTEIAIKIVAEQYLDRVIHEARMLHQLKGISGIPKICKIYHDTHLKRVCIVQEYIAGTPLDPAATENIDELFQQVVKVIAAAHEKGVAHRDLKPANILVTQEKTAFIVDWGEATQEQMAVSLHGTISFMDPEQRSATPKHPYLPQAHDVWSLGVLFYLLRTKQVPFPQGCLTQDRTVESLNTSGLSRRDEALIRSLLHINPQKRLSAQQLLKALREDNMSPVHNNPS